MSHIRYFLALSRDGNFTAAARHCGIAQPSLTNAIKRFERQMGGPLFRRTAAATTLTELGEAVRPHLERLMQCADDAQCAAKAIQSQQQISTAHGGYDAQPHPFRRRSGSRRVRRHDFEQNSNVRDHVRNAAADNLG
jgi:DNA-binding transcriptional LysR family regulator